MPWKKMRQNLVTVHVWHSLKHCQTMYKVQILAHSQNYQFIKSSTEALTWLENENSFSLTVSVLLTLGMYVIWHLYTHFDCLWHNWSKRLFFHHHLDENAWFFHSLFMMKCLFDHTSFTDLFGFICELWWVMQNDVR